MFGDMMGKLQEMKQEMETTKKRLDGITVTGEAPGGKIKITVTGNRKVTDVNVAEELLQEDKEQLEDFLVMAMNDALAKAEKVNEAEMSGVAKGMLPGMM